MTNVQRRTHGGERGARTRRPLFVATARRSSLVVRRSTACLAAGPLQIRAGVRGALARLAQLGADGATAARRQLAGLLEGLPECQQLVGPGIRLRVAIVGPLELDEVTHLVEARMHPETDARQQ